MKRIRSGLGKTQMVDARQFSASVGQQMQAGRHLPEVTCGGASKEEHIYPLFPWQKLVHLFLCQELVPIIICGEGNVSMAFIDLRLGKDG